MSEEPEPSQEPAEELDGQTSINEHLVELGEKPVLKIEGARTDRRGTCRLSGAGTAEDLEKATAEGLGPRPPIHHTHAPRIT